MERGKDMSFESKVILLAVADIIRTSKDLNEALDRLEVIANAEGILVKKREPKRDEKEDI